MHPANSRWNGAGTIPAGTDIGHVHLKVSGIDRALDFYCGVLGFTAPLDLEALLGEAQ